MKNKEEKILKILELMNIDEEEFRKEIHKIMYPGPFYHELKKCKEKGLDERNFDDYGNDYYVRVDKDTQYYFCEKYGCKYKWTEEEIKKEEDLNKIKGCIPPSEIWNLDYLSNILDNEFKKYKKEYLLAIGLLYNYNILKKDDDVKEKIIELNIKLKKENNYYYILEWWTFAVDHKLNILAHLIVTAILEKEFDVNDTLGYQLIKKNKEEE